MAFASTDPNSDEPDSDQPVNAAAAVSAGWLSFGFWVCLFLSSGIYALVFLSPKLVAEDQLAVAERSNQWKLVELQRRIDYYDRVARAFQNDPAYQRERARSDFEVRPEGEETIPVPDYLTLQIRGGAAKKGETEPSRPDQVGVSSWYVPICRMVVSHPEWSNALLAFAAVVVVFAFTFMQQPRPLNSRGEPC